MIRFHSPVAVGLGMALLGAGLSLFTPTPAATQAAATNVLVTNATTQPVPVAVIGSPYVRLHPTFNQVQIAPTANTVKIDPTANTVKIDPTGNLVKSVQNGGWNVGLTAAGNVVRVGNTKTTPVPTYDARDAQTPFQASMQNGGSLTVPAGKRLVIEYVGIWAYTIAPGIVYNPILSTQIGGGVPMAHRLGLENLGTTGDFTFFQSGQATRIYADPGTTVQWNTSAWNVSSSVSEVSVSGYLVAYP